MAVVTSEVSIGHADGPDFDDARASHAVTAPGDTGPAGAAGDDERPPPRRGEPRLVERGLRWMRPHGPRPSLRERLAPPMPQERWWIGWGGPLLVTLIAGVLRFWRLGSPNAVVFDETYYAKDAYTLWKFGFEYNWQNPQFANPALLHHKILLGTGPEYVVHPPLGKWMIGIGEYLFSMDPFGWRFITAVVGTLSVLMLARITRRMTRSTLLGCVAGLLLSFDGLEFVMSRTSLLDIIVMFWILAAFGCLVVDRDKVRERLVAWREGFGPEQLAGFERGPGLGLRPWRIAAGVCLGAAAASKWNGMFALAAFGVMAVLWDRGARRAVGVRRPSLATLRKDMVPALLSLVVVGGAVYLASWSGWLASSNGYFRNWAATNKPSNVLASLVPGPLRSLWHYEYTVFQFNANLETPHPYQSNPWSWLVMGRPVSFYYESPKLGSSGCHVNQCSQAVLALGTPTLWWFATGCLVFMLWRWAFRRDWRAGAVLAGMVGCWLPWLHYSARTIFEFYAVSFAPFMVLGATLTLGSLIGRSDASPSRRMWGAIGAGTVVLSVVVAFVYFYPIYTGETIPYSSWLSRMWLQSWI